MATEPSIQLIMSARENGFGARFIIRFMVAAAKLERPTPMRMSVTAEAVRSAAKAINAVPASAPTIAAVGIAQALSAAYP